MENSFHSNTSVIGLIGHPIKYSYSPFIHNVSIELKKLDYIYLPFDVPSSMLKNAIKGMIALNIKGLNVTIPHKESIITFLDNISDEAAIIGAVNTVVNDQGKLKGYNTDTHGVYESLIGFKDQIANKPAVIVGAGGVARAVVYTLIRYFKPSNIILINRTLEKAENMKRHFQQKMKYENFNCLELFPSEIVDVLSSSKLIINCTPLGMLPDVDDSFTLIKKSFVKDQIVFDLVYNPAKSKLLNIAEEQGATIIGGLKMLVYQAAHSFKLFTNEEFPIDEVYKSLQLMFNS